VVVTVTSPGQLPACISQQEISPVVARRLRIYGRLPFLILQLLRIFLRSWSWRYVIFFSLVLEHPPTPCPLFRSSFPPPSPTPQVEVNSNDPSPWPPFPLIALPLSVEAPNVHRFVRTVPVFLRSPLLVFFPAPLEFSRFLSPELSDDFFLSHGRLFLFSIPLPRQRPPSPDVCTTFLLPLSPPFRKPPGAGAYWFCSSLYRRPDGRSLHPSFAPKSPRSH